MEISFHDWGDSGHACQTVAALDWNEVQVWLARVPMDETAPAGFALTLSPAEQARANRFLVTPPRCEFVFGRAFLRQLLGAVLQIDPATVTLAYETRGKPRLAVGTPSDLRFNLAHSGGLVAVALARGRAVGVDVEWMKPLPDWRELASTIFSPRERAALYDCPPVQQRAAFFHGWTRKEAWLKATGEGLNDNLPAIEVTLNTGKAPEFLALPGGPAALSRWGIATIPLPPEFAGAVVWENPAIVAKPRD